MAKRATIQCSRCGRKFSMAAHLARHMSTTHASKSTKAKGGGSKAGYAAASVASAASGAAFAGAVRELQAHRADLAAQHSQVGAQIDALDAALAALGGTERHARPVRAAPTAPRRGRAPASGSLREHIARVMQAAGGGMGVRDIESAVLGSGYSTKSKNLGHAINKALSGMKNVKRVSRGVYQLR